MSKARESLVSLDSLVFSSFNNIGLENLFLRISHHLLVNFLLFIIVRSVLDNNSGVKPTQYFGARGSQDQMRRMELN